MDELKANAASGGGVVLGGAYVEWADEWWKGRVIEATSFDTRTDTMGDLCPDLEANVHSPCGYPTLANGEDTGSQPDSYVNEEWFGLFHVSEPTCKSGGSWGLKVDKLKARDAWLRLQRPGAAGAGGRRLLHRHVVGAEARQGGPADYQSQTAASRELVYPPLPRTNAAKN